MERESLLAAIRANPREDVPRLMYADWLDEYGESEVDGATVEFIRCSCSMKVGGSDRMPKAGYNWVASNWKRLIPGTLRLHAPYRVLPDYSNSYLQPSVIFMVDGRKVWMKIGLYGKRNRIVRESKVYSCSLELQFWKGFVQEFKCWSDFTRKVITPVLELEQPLMGMGMYMGVRKPVIEISPDSQLESEWPLDAKS